MFHSRISSSLKLYGLKKTVITNLHLQSFGTKSKKRVHYSKIQSIIDNDAIIDFKTLMRKFYIKAHPDLLKSTNLEASEVNDRSFQELNNVISTIKGNVEYPPMMNRFIPFYIFSEDRIAITMHKLNLKTAGGDSRKQLMKCFSGFFQAIGLLGSNEDFRWNEEFFPPLEGKPIESDSDSSTGYKNQDMHNNY